MLKKLAKIKYLPNNFEVVQDGDHVICAISGKKIPLEKLNYFHLLCVQIHCPGFSIIIFSRTELRVKVIESIL